MNINEAKELLKQRKANFKETSWASEKEYWKHISECYYYEHASDDRVKALVIPCKNGKRHIELQFDEKDGEYVFKELYFGSFCFEINEFLEEGETLEDVLIGELDKLLQGRYTVVSVVNAAAGRFVYDGIYPNISAELRAEVAEKLNKANSLWGRLKKRRMIYEIFDNESIISGEFNSLSKLWKATELLHSRSKGDPED